MQKTFNSFNILTKVQQQHKTQSSKIFSNFDENDWKNTVSSIARDTSFKCCKFSAFYGLWSMAQLYVSLVWAMSSYIANCGSLPVCAWRYGTLLTLKCKTSPDRATIILLIKQDTLKSNFVLECELMAMNGNVMQKGFFIWHRKGCEWAKTSSQTKTALPPHYLKINGWADK